MKININKKELESKKANRNEYIADTAEKVLNAAEEIFDRAKPTGNDMIDIMALASVFIFSRQVKMHCKSKTTMQSVMKSAMWALNLKIDTYAAPMLDKPETWDEVFDEQEEER